MKIESLTFWDIGLMLCFLVFLLVLYRLHVSRGNKFSFEDLFMDAVSQKASMWKLLGFGAFFCTSWMVLQVNREGPNFIGALGAYLGAWALAAVTPSVVSRFGSTPEQMPVKETP